VVENTGGPLDPSVQGEIDAILDGEVLDSLRAGGPYASAEFIRERLDTFSDAWGGASLRIQSLGEGLLLGRFRLSAKGVGSSVRLYRTTRGEVALLRAWHEGGVPEVYRWGNPKGGGVEFLLAWAGEAGAQSWPLRLELWRMRAGTLAPVWRSGTDIPTGCGSPTWTSPRAASPSGAAPLSRLEAGLRWAGGAGGSLSPGPRGRAGPGRAPGLQRLAPRASALGHALLRRPRRGDGKTLAELVPDAALRARLPRGLVPEAACDAQNPDTSGTAIVAAAVPLVSGARSPWSLWWGRNPSGWRLSGAAPVLE
jgi:hypothetical protein